MADIKINRRIVLAGGPSTGKTSVLNELKRQNFHCFNEVARDILIENKLKGLGFINNPIEISKKILQKRHEDYFEASKIKSKRNLLFYDRGVHEITAYLKSINKSSKYWDDLIYKYNYDLIFIFNPWKEIYIKDESRFEDFHDAKKISPFIFDIYEDSKTPVVEVPNTNIEERVNFILKSI